MELVFPKKFDQI